MMTEILIGKSTQEANVIFQNIHQLLTDEDDLEVDQSVLGKLTILSGVKEFPMRVKCATLGWHIMQAAMNNKQSTISTE